ncbi:hypothetical protein BDD12DRAFT_937659 [Trichophaea hybrida]|nr:hypothetical protein BDD12DRAFT_937659 [Trichophaea hybrida]
MPNGRNLELSEVATIMEQEYGFGATPAQYKKKIRAWKLQKSIPKDKAFHMIKKQDQRLLEGKETYFEFNGQPVNNKLDRARKRFALELVDYSQSPSASTPSDVEYMTPRSPTSELDVSSPRPWTSSIDAVMTTTDMGNSSGSTNDHQDDFSLENGVIQMEIDSPQEYLDTPGPGGTERMPNLEEEIITTEVSKTYLSPPFLVTRDLDERVKKAMDVFFHYARHMLENTAAVEFDNVCGIINNLDYGLLPCKLAGSYIAVSAGTFTERLSSYSDKLQNTLNHVVEGEITKRSSAIIESATFNISFEALERNHKESARILRLCGFLHNEDIPHELIRRGLSLDDEEVQRVIDMMVHYSLIEQQSKTNNAFSIPSNIHSWLRESRHITQHEEELWGAFRLVSTSICEEPQNPKDFIFERGIPIHLVACWRYIKEHFGPMDLKHYPNTLAMYHAACLLFRQGMWTDAEDIYWRIMAVSKKALGSEHPTTLASMFNLAAVYVNTMRWNEAKELILEVLEVRKRLLGHQHPETVRGNECLADIFSNQGRFCEAEMLELQVLDWRMRVLPPEHPDTLTSFSKLAWTYCAQRQWEKAEKMARHAVEGRKKILGHEHPDTLSSMMSLAFIFKSQRRLKDAESLEVRALGARRKRVLGYQHPDTLTSMNDLASTYLELRRFKEAAELGLQALEGRKRVLDPQHLDTLDSITTVARIRREGDGPSLKN